MARLIKKSRQLYGKVFDFTPMTFILPNEYKQFIKEYNLDGNENNLWICKPTDLSRGRGISIIKSMDDLKYD